MRWAHLRWDEMSWDDMRWSLRAPPAAPRTVGVTLQHFNSPVTPEPQQLWINESSGINNRSCLFYTPSKQTCLLREKNVALEEANFSSCWRSDKRKKSRTRRLCHQQQQQQHHVRLMTRLTTQLTARLTVQLTVRSGCSDAGSPKLISRSHKVQLISRQIGQKKQS